MGLIKASSSSTGRCSTLLFVPQSPLLAWTEVGADRLHPSPAIGLVTIGKLSLSNHTQHDVGYSELGK
jgi:hypothetical protein